MATRDVKMTLSVETLGEQDISKLAKSVRELAKEGGDAAPEFALLADEIDRLGEQKAALDTLKALQTTTVALEQTQQKSSETTATLGDRLKELATVSEAARARQQALATELQASQAQYRANRDALQEMTAQTTRAQQQEDSYIEQKKALKLAQIAQRQESERLRAELSAAGKAADEAEAAESKLQKAYDRSAASTAKAGAALAENKAQVKDSADAAQALGVATDNAGVAQAEIALNLARAGAQAERLELQMRSLNDAEKQLAETQAFEKLLVDAQRLVTASEYVQLFDQALENLDATRKKEQAQAAEAKWQKEAFQIVEAAEAAQRLAKETAILAEVERELVQINAFEKLHQSAQKLVQDQAYVRDLTAELDRLDAQSAKTAAEAKNLEGAFNAIGVKSVQELETEITQLKTAMATLRENATATGNTLSGAFTAGKTKLTELERELRALNGQLTTGDRLAGLFKNSLGQIAAGNIIADGVGYLVNKVKELGVAAIGAIVQLDQLRRGLTAVYQSSATAAAQIVFLRNTANAAGVAFGSISQAFVRFSAATASANIGLTQTNELFASVVRASGALGLSGETVSGILEALGQMASKGTVSMEELRQQLGDRLPGALSLVAQGLGVTESQLIKLVESGSLAARDLFPALTKALNSMKGETDGLVPSFERLKNVLTETAQNAGDAGWTALLTAGIKGITLAAGLLVLPLSALTEIIFGAAKAAGVLAAAAVTLTNPIAALKDLFSEAATRQTNLTAAFDAALGATQAATTAQEKHNAALTAAGAEAAKLEQATATTGTAQLAQAKAAELAANKNFDLGSKLVQLKGYIDELYTSQEKDTESKGKLAKAAQIQGDTLVQLAELRGQESATLEANVEAANLNLVALTNLSDAHRTETELLTIKRQAIIDTALAQEGTLKGREQEIEAINKKITVSRGELEQSVQTVAAARAELSVRQLQSTAYQDNARNLAVYTNALNAAREALAFSIDLQKNGLATDEQVIAAKKRLAEAQFLYNDALKDTLTKIDLENKIKQSSISLSQAKLNVDQQSLLSTAAMLRAQGDLTGAVQFEILAKSKQIDIIRLTMLAKNEEAKATITATNAELKNLDVNDAQYKQQKALLEIRLESAKIKQIEAQASESVIQGIQREIDALRNSTTARNDNTQSIKLDTASRLDNVSAMDKQVSALDKLYARYKTVGNDPTLTNDSFKKNSDGSAAGTFTNTLPVDKAFDVVNRSKAGDTSITKEEAALALKQATDALNDMRAAMKLSPGIVSTQYIQSTEALYLAAKAAYDKANAAEIGKPVSGENSTQTVIVKIGASSTSLNMATSADAANLTKMLQTLEEESKRAS